MVCDSHFKSKTRAKKMFRLSHSKNDLRECVLRVKIHGEILDCHASKYTRFNVSCFTFEKFRENEEIFSVPSKNCNSYFKKKFPNVRKFFSIRLGDFPI